MVSLKKKAVYRVQWYSQFAGKWQDYATITHGAQPIDYRTRAEADNRMTMLQMHHPRDEFRIRKL